VLCLHLQQQRECVLRNVSRNVAGWILLTNNEENQNSFDFNLLFRACHSLHAPQRECQYVWLKVLVLVAETAETKKTFWNTIALIETNLKTQHQGQFF
jgi:hypothetical protein